MPKRKTSEAVSTASELPLLNGKTSGFKTIPKYHVNLALTMYLRSASLINDDEEVTNFNKAPDSLDVKVEKIT